MRRLMSADGYIIDPRELARRDSTWSGSIALDRFSRLTDFLEDSVGELNRCSNVKIELRFSLDAERRCRLTGSVEFPARCQCHRCLKPVDLWLEVELNALLVFDEDEANSLSENYEVIQLTKGNTSLVDLIEDDLLLSIPKDVCKFGPSCENAPTTRYPSTSLDEGKVAKLNNPFEILADLKKN